MIIATAGHVDHGKTTLLEALTGINADRLPEEKKRGMTIDLGYAYWPQPDGRTIGFIDVPGHEKFLANMLAGIGGIDHALLIVACDDGVMAQTREHLAILRLAGKPALTVALTKADRVSDERVAQVRAEVERMLAAQGWLSLKLFVTAAVNGTGIGELQQHLQQLTARSHAEHHRFRLAIDRAFTVKGAGLVVTGTALSGSVAIGDSLWLTGADSAVRVRGIHAQNQPAERAHAGQRIALNITGDVQKEAVSRGDWLLARRPGEPSERVIVELVCDAPLTQWQPVHLHHAASHVTGRVSLLTDTLAELVFDTPLWLADNDRLIVRDISARTTLAGARVILSDSPRRGKRKPAFLAWLAQLTASTQHEQVLAAHLARGAVSLPDFAWARQLSDEGLQRLVAQVNGIVAGDMLLGDTTAQAWKSTLRAVLARYHEQHSDEPGPGRERLRRMALPAEPEALVLALIETMRQTGELVNRQGWLSLPGFDASFNDKQRALWARVEALFGDEPWWVRDIAAQTGQEEQAIRQLLRFAAQQGLIVAIVKDRYYRQERLLQFADLIRVLDREKGSAVAADFRDRLKVGRKLAIQILEYFDRTGFTRRKGNTHLLRDGKLFARLE